MAKQPQENQATSAFLEEVEEDIRQERIKKLWRRFGPPAAIVAVLIVLGVFSWSFYTNSVEQKAQEMSDRFISGVDQLSAGQIVQAQQSLEELAQSGVKGYEFSALTALANQYSLEGDKNKALGYYDRIISGDFDKAYKDLGLVLAAQTAIGTTDYSRYQTDVEILAASNASLKWMAKEIKALQFLSLSQNDAAKTELEALMNSVEAPGDVRMRAAGILEIIK